MPDPLLLPMADQPTAERADAARNREALLCAARRLVEEQGVAAVTMEAVAAAAGAYSFAAVHVRHLLAALGVDGDLPILATALLAPLEIPILDQQLHSDGFDVERLLAGWEDLARRITGHLRAGR